MQKNFFVYILASRKEGVLYVGVTSDLPKRIWEHREKIHGGFTRRYNVMQLVWYEAHDDAPSAITREKQMKKWNRAWKIALIEKSNPSWRDLYEELGPAI